jgi:SAM-dependent methyltransferase
VNLDDLQTTWEALGREDPLWAILTDADKKGRRWNAKEFFVTGVREVAAMMADVRSLGDALGSRAALDFGCGVGRLTEPLADHFTEVVGVDLSPSMIRLAQQYNRKPDRCRYVVNATADLALFPTGYFDFVLSYLTLQHIPPWYTKRYLREFVRVVSQRGMICFQAPSAPSTVSAALRVPVWRAKSAVRALLARIGVGNGARMAMYGISCDVVDAVLQEAGGRLVDVRRVDDFTPGWKGYRYIATKE